MYHCRKEYSAVLWRSLQGVQIGLAKALWNRYVKVICLDL